MMITQDEKAAIAKEFGGGPAFPVTDECSGMLGMTLRDYFAAKADVSKMQISSNEIAEKLAGRKRPSGALEQFEWEISIVAKVRYMAADAMLEARK